ncbi:P1 family peptidase [Polycladidibacter stylochi]|uniref:P1 family peptidase n=1 Tax=Polycladidibacter stylochi TaxID=1807766 RepID=UPI00082D2322|nr:P1 family peptidase [Pseudovibrio stylochi]
MATSDWQNLITDVPGILVGNAEDHTVKTGSTVLLADKPMVASVAILGGAPGTRDIALLEPHQTVDQIDALVLSGGSAFGLDATSGVQSFLRRQGKGFQVYDQHIPIVPTAILFDMVNGGNKDWGDPPPYRNLGYQAAQNAGKTFAIGTAGAGVGALTADLKGGLGSASAFTSSGTAVGALVAINPLGRVTQGMSPHFWAAPFERNGEFGAKGIPSSPPKQWSEPVTKFSLSQSDPSNQSNTTIAIIATDLILSKAEAKRIAIAAHDGISRAIYPSHTPYDGDLVFVTSTGRRQAENKAAELLELGVIAANTLTRAIARGVYEATPQPNDLLPTWQQNYAHL